ncbi:flavin reductase family protein [Pseudoflavonifractor sp. DSM 107456]|uniref:Flavin reductase family protein n=1 Tax=Pseudoflavonifractor gallinarum TaxID=2779352 RepID=A0ABR9R9Q9_9FIRM|nr:flavin reductase family protein [Pseudoflavonifractor gallinarum]MBE5055058.1 flavin reductase family protein [Pseudoflavonifractor gallinarum]
MFRKIRPEEIDQNLFSMLNDQWMLVTAGTPEHCNTMTASWGGLGVLWRRNVAMCVIRPQRYTMEFVEREGYFTLSFFGDKYRRELALCGAKSGRELDKIRECGFTVAAAEGDAPYFEEAELVIVCRKLYWQDLEPGHFTDPAVLEQCYPEKDYHRMYIGEIVEVLQKA